MSYLSHRKQFVSVGNNTSNEESIKRGVPQGSVLGPLWFPLYTSEIEDLFIAHAMDAMIYADDTQFYIALSNSNWTEWSTIQGVIGRVISKSAEREARGRFEITSTITP